MFIAIVSALVGRSIAPGLVVLGQMSIHGVLNRVEGLADKLRISLDAGAKRILIPTGKPPGLRGIAGGADRQAADRFLQRSSKATFKALAEI